MSTGPGDDPASTTAARASRGVRRRRGVARTLVVVDAVVLTVTLFRLGFVEPTEHPGLVTTAWIAVAVFLLAFPFMGFRDAAPGGRRRDRRRYDRGES